MPDPTPGPPYVHRFDLPIGEPLYTDDGRPYYPTQPTHTITVLENPREPAAPPQALDPTRYRALVRGDDCGCPGDAAPYPRLHLDMAAGRALTAAAARRRRRLRNQRAGEL